MKNIRDMVGDRLHLDLADQPGEDAAKAGDRKPSRPVRAIKMATRPKPACLSWVVTVVATPSTTSFMSQSPSSGSSPSTTETPKLASVHCSAYLPHQPDRAPNIQAPSDSRSY